MTAKIRMNPEFIKVNEILEQLKIKEQFVQKANNTFGIKGTKRSGTKEREGKSSPIKTAKSITGFPFCNCNCTLWQ